MALRLLSESLASGRQAVKRRGTGNSPRGVTVTGIEFIRRFLLHVLRRGCTKVRYYGIWSSSCRDLLDKAHTLLAASSPNAVLEKVADLPLKLIPPVRRMANRCLYCKIGNLIPIQVVYPQRKRSP